MDNQMFGQRLKQLRQRKAAQLGRERLPQRYVAKQLHVSPGAYASWENGRTRPDVDSLCHLATFYEVSTDYLLGVSPQLRSDEATTIAPNGLIWSLRRPAETDDEYLGIALWQRLSQGDSLTSIAADLNISLWDKEIQRLLIDVWYGNMIRIHEIPMNHTLEQQLIQHYKLRDARVVNTGHTQSDVISSILLGEASRLYFKRYVRPTTKVGLAGGSAVAHMVYALRRGDCQSIEVYPLAVSPVIEAVSLDANTLVGTLVNRHVGYDVRGYILQYATPSELRKNRNSTQLAPTRRILAKSKSVDIAFMGLGTLGRKRAEVDLLGDLVDTTGPGLNHIRQRGAVGDVLYHVIDENGTPIVPEISDLICSIRLTDLQELIRLQVRVVAIAWGVQKLAVTQTAIEQGYTNTLITDERLAQALLENHIQ